MVMWNARQLIEAVIQLDSVVVIKVLTRVVPSLVGKGLTTEEIVSALDDALEPHGITFRPKFVNGQQSLNYDELMANIVGGQLTDDGHAIVNYDMERGLEAIFDGEDPSQVKDFLTAVRNIIDHEFIHREQLSRSNWLARGSDPQNTVQYLANPAEAMAMARQAANQFVQLGYKPAQVLQLLRSPWKKQDGVPDRGESDIFWNYTEHFDGSDKDFRRFIQYMTSYLTHYER